MILSSPLLILLRYWLFQGMLYMNKAEVLHRFVLESMAFYASYSLLSSSFEGFFLLLLCFVIAHSWSCFFNGHPWAVLVHDAGVHSVCFYKDKVKFLNYVEQMKLRLERKNPRYLGGALVFGSIVRGVFRETSDLDVRYISHSGFFNALLSAHLVFLERLRATFFGFPMDLYMFRDAEETKRKMDVVSEDAVALHLDDLSMGELFPKLSTLEKMKKELLSSDNVIVVGKPPRAVAISSGGNYLTNLLASIDRVTLRATIATTNPGCKMQEVEAVSWKTFCFLDDKFSIKNIILSFLLILRDRPDYIITTGDTFVIATCLIGKSLGSKVIYIEMAETAQVVTKTGRFLYKLSNLYIVRGGDFKAMFPKAEEASSDSVNGDVKSQSDLINHFIKRE